MTSSDLRDAFRIVMSDIGYFELSPTLAVAVSGGADSMALLLLAHEWVKPKNGHVIALTVDHGLRQESAAEATQVKKWCAKYHIEHHTLKSSPPKGGSQEHARDLRYSLLTDWCKKNHVLHLLTAHHAGDQAETLFFRLARGSFIEGLACIPAVSTRAGVRLIRPLLNTPKRALEGFLDARAQPWIDDPSNHSPRYTRNRIRARLSGQDVELRAGAVAARFAAIRSRMEHRLAADLCEAVDLFPGPYAEIKKTAFDALGKTRQLKILSALVRTIGGRDMPPRTEKLHRLHHDLLSDPPIKRRALAGAHFTYHKKKQRWQVDQAQPLPHILSNEPPKPLAGEAFLGLSVS